MPPDKDLETKCKHLCEGVSECLHIVSHDPSLALYRVQEHIRKSTLPLVEHKLEMNQMHVRLQGACFDVENAMTAVRYMCNAASSFDSIRDSLKTTMYYRQQLDYERLRRDSKRTQMMHSESNDSLSQELRKSKSMGLLRTLSIEKEECSHFSRSTSSTPVSEAPLFEDTAHSSQHGLSRDNIMAASFEDDTVRDTAKDDDDRSSTPTSGADSPLPSDPEDDIPEEHLHKQP